MTTLDKFLVKEKKVTDIKTARILIKEGLVKVEKNIIKNPDFPASLEDRIDILDKKIAKMPFSYWVLKDVDRISKLFNPTNDILCFGLNKEEIKVLLSMGTALHVIGLDYEKLPRKVKVTKGNPVFDDLKKKIKTKFNLIIIKLGVNVFNLFKIIEKYKDLLINDGGILIKIDTKNEKFEDQWKIIEEMTKSLDLKIQSYIEPKYSKNDVWVLLKD